MRFGIPLSFFLLCFLITSPLRAQEKAVGPVIDSYGPVWDIPEADFPTDPEMEWRVVFDVMQAPEDPNAVSPWLETAARFLNLHVRAGVPKERLHVAVVVHNRATPGLLSQAEYQARFGTDNPNAPLLQALMDAGVEVVLCGQSSRSRDVPIAKTLPGTRLALSAMTAFITYQEKGYRLIKF